MEKDISKYHHYCKASGLGFGTFEEWYEYMQHHDHREVVAEYKGFKYSMYDVCLNPHVTRLHISGMLRCDIYTAESAGGWSYGYDFAYHLGSASGCASYCLSGDKGVYTTERRAIEACLRLAISYCEYHNAGSKAIDALRNEIANTRQLNLFEAI